MLKKSPLFLFCLFFSVCAASAAGELTLEDLYGTRQITREDDSNPLKWDEFYR